MSPESPEPDKWIEAAFDKRLAELTDEELTHKLDQLRPPKLDPKQAAAQKVSEYLNQFVIRPKTK